MKKIKLKKCKKCKENPTAFGYSGQSPFEYTYQVKCPKCGRYVYESGASCECEKVQAKAMKEWNSNN